MMNSAYRSVHLTASRLINPNPISSSLLHLLPLYSCTHAAPPRSSPLRRRFLATPSSSSFYIPMAAGDDQVPPPESHLLEKQFESFRVQLEESAALREQIRAVVMEIESATRLIQANLLLVHQSRPIPGKWFSTAQGTCSWGKNESWRHLVFWACLRTRAVYLFLRKDWIFESRIDILCLKVFTLKLYGCYLLLITLLFLLMEQRLSRKLKKRSMIWRSFTVGLLRSFRSVLDSTIGRSSSFYMW